MNKNNVMMVFHREQGKAPRYVVFSVAGRLVKANILLGYHTSSGGSGVVEMVHIKTHAKEYLINSFLYMLLWTENSEDKGCSARVYSTCTARVQHDCPPGHKDCLGLPSWKWHL